MIAEVADILKSYIDDLDWVDKIGGLVHPVTKGDKTFPVCLSSGDYDDLVPNSKKRSVVYFEESGGSSVSEMSSRRMRIEIPLRLVCWYNLKRLNENVSSNNLMIDIMNTLPRTFKANGNVLAASIEIEDMGTGNDIFSDYSYNEQRQFLMYPFGAFYMDIIVNAWVGIGCADNVNINDSIC